MQRNVTELVITHHDSYKFAFKTFPFQRVAVVVFTLHASSEMTMGQWVTGHGSSGSTNPSGSRGSRVSTRDPLTHDQVNKIPKTG